MPFEGHWAYNVLTTAGCGSGNSETSHPSCHETYSGDWATDLYALADTDVKLNVSSPTGNVSLAWDAATGTCGETRRVKVSVDNTYIGRVSFTHLKNSASTATPPTNGMPIGKIANLSCNPGGNLRHVHMEVDNASDTTYACYMNHSTEANTAGHLLSESESLGIIGSSNTGTKQACTQETGTQPPPPDPLALSFVRLNHPAGNVEVISYSESSNYQTATENTFAGYPAVPQDGNVIPVFQPDGDLSLVRLNHPSGHVEIATYSEASGYHNLVEYALTGYPSVPGDGSVIPLYQYDGDLSFIRLNHASGHVEVVAYSEASNFQTMTENRLTAYPAVETNGAVIPMYWLNDDLVFLRMNHYSGHVELISYSKSSNYQNAVNNSLLAYPAVAAPGVAPDGSVIPMFQPQDGDLSFVKTNHYSGHPEVVTYSVGSNFQTMNDYDLSSYPAVAPNTGVVVRYSN